MDERHQESTRDIPGWIVTIAALVYVAFDVVARPEELGQVALPLLALVATAALLARQSAITRHHTAPRLAPALVLAAAVALPAPAAMLVAAAALAAGTGRSLIGPPGGGPSAAGASLIATAVASYFAATIDVAQPGSPSTLVLVALLFLILQALTVGLSLALSAGGTHPARDASWPRIMLIELVNIPLAWLLITPLRAGTWVTLGAICALSVLAGMALARLERTRRALRRSARTLSRRRAELATLHSIGREILSTLDTDRILSVLDRECRKIFDTDHFYVALLDPDTSRLFTAYRRRHGDAPESRGPMADRGVVAWVAENKRSCRIDDLARVRADSPLLGPPIEADSRSVLAVPLLVEDRVVGVFTLQSRDESAFDDSAVELLTTIAQQAAVAIDNSRHYHLATIDSLTGFHTRDYFFRRLADEDQRVRRYGGAFALLMVDLDGFKEINDRNGHLAGDQYLSEIATTIRGQLRGADLPCRYGGDEFCLLLPETDLDGARTIGERVRSAVSGRIVGVDGLALRTTVSVGVAAFPEHSAEDLNALMRKADEALYRAKRAGRDRVVPFAA